LRQARFSAIPAFDDRIVLMAAQRPSKRNELAPGAAERQASYQPGAIRMKRSTAGCIATSGVLLLDAIDGRVGAVAADVGGNRKVVDDIAERGHFYQQDAWHS
jgi:hypothetical protein